MVEVRQQIMGQVGQQDIAFLAQETVLSSGFQVQTALVVAKLLDFCSAAIVVTGHKKPFGRQSERRNVVAVTKSAILEPAFDEHAHRTTIIGRWVYFTKPDILISVPALDLPGQGFCPAVGHAFGNQVVISAQQPTELFITSGAAIYAPNRASALGRG